MKTHLVVHHSATADSNTLSWPVIRQNHKNKGWRDVGYHFGVEYARNGHVEMLVGRPLFARAAAAYQENMNVVGVHVCFIGNFDVEPHPADLINYAAPHLADICELLQIPVDEDHVIGHRNVMGVTKSCPGENFNMLWFRETLQGAL